MDELDAEAKKRHEALEAERIDREELLDMAACIKKCPPSTPEQLSKWMKSGSRERENGGGHGGGEL